MNTTSREIVRRALTFQSPPRIPRHMWVLPWAQNRFDAAIERINKRFPQDFTGAAQVSRPSTREKGSPFSIGAYTDPWGCEFTNIQEGVIGEVKRPVLQEITDWKRIEPPYETLPQDFGAARDRVNRSCHETDRFTMANCCPRPWEQVQFLRGTVAAMMDTMTPDEGLRNLLHGMQQFYLTELEFWVSTDVDAVSFMDDWGSQNGLLIDPATWRELFLPLYREYCDLAHAHNKFAFMHSDGNITAILPDLVTAGVDAVNSQLFCMDMKEIAEIGKGRITFWGEIDRQHVLTSPDPQVGRAAVRTVAQHLYSPDGGVIAQFEFGPGANPDMPEVIFEEWEKIGRQSAAVFQTARSG